MREEARNVLLLCLLEHNDDVVQKHAEAKAGGVDIATYSRCAYQRIVLTGMCRDMASRSKWATGESDALPKRRSAPQASLQYEVHQRSVRYQGF
jgi:hypothetical protein